MSTELGVLLRQLIADPSRLDEVSPEHQAAIIASLRAAIAVAPRPPAEPPDTSPARGVTAWSLGDVLLIDEAAEMLRVSRRWLYRHWKTLPYARKLSRKMLRFSRSGITRSLVSKRHD
jgi:predicted DNA-binding transcriptional regulator AlpA